MNNEENLGKNAANSGDLPENVSPQLESGSNPSNKTKKSNNNPVKRDSYLWENDPRLEQVKQFLYSRDSWLNKTETEFVRQSVIRKWKGEFALLVGVATVGLVGVFLIGLAWIGQREASEKTIQALTQSAEANRLSKNELEAAADILRARKELQKFSWLGNLVFSKQDKEVAEVQATLHKVYYAVRERNRLQNREPIYDMALSTDGKLLAVVGKNDTVVIYQVPSNNKSLINTIWAPIRQLKEKFGFKQNAIPDNKLDHLDSLSTGQGNVSSVAFVELNKTKYLATGAENGTVKLFKIYMGKNGKLEHPESDGFCDQLNLNEDELKLCKPKVKSVKYMEFYPNPKDKKSGIIAIAQYNGTVNLFKINDEGKIQSQNRQQIPPSQKDETDEREELESIYGIAFSSEGLLAILRVNEFEIWNTTALKKQPDYKISNKDKAHKRLFDPLEVYSVAFIGGDKLAIGKDDGKVTTFSITKERNGVKLTETNKEEFKAFDTKQKALYGIAFSQDGKLATLGADDRVVLWDTSSSQQIGFIQSHEESVPIKVIASSRNGQYLATGDNNGTVRIWNASGQPIRRINTELEYIWDLALSPNGKLVAIVGEADRVSIWNTIEGEKLYDEKLNNNNVVDVHSVAFTPDGSLAVGQANGTVTLLKINDKDKKVTKDKELTIKQAGIVHSIAFNRYRKQVVTLVETLPKENTDEENTGSKPKHQLILWSLSEKENSWDELKRTPLNLESISNKNIAFRPDGLLAISQANGIVRFWDINKEDWVGSLETQQGNISSLTYTSDKILATAGEDGLVKLWNISIKQPHKIDIPSNQPENIVASVVSPSGNRLATIHTGGKVKLWDLSKNPPEQFSEENQSSNGEQKPKLSELSINDNDVVFSNNGNRLATIDTDDKVKLWDISGNKVTPLFSNDQDQQSKEDQEPKLSKPQVVFSDDGNKLVTVDTSKTVKIWDISKTKPELLFPRSEDQKQTLNKLNTTNVALINSSEGNQNQLATVDNEKIVNVWDILEDTLKLTDSIPVEQDKVTSIASSHDGKFLVTGGDDGTVRLGDTSGKLFYQINTQQGSLKNVVFSPDSKLLATIGEKENTLKVWLILDNKLHPFKAEQSGIYSVAFNYDDSGRSQLVVAKENGSINQWELGKKNDLGNDNQLVKGICNLVKDYLESSPDIENSDRKLCENVNLSTIADQISIGDKILIPSLTNSDNKLVGVQAIAAGNFKKAVSPLEASLNTEPNDPEALIYLNNAKIGIEPSYTIAVPVPIQSNPNGALEILRGVAQAQNEINEKGGINGKLLKVLIADDEGNPEMATKIAQELVDRSEVLGVVGHYSSDVALEVRKVYEEKLPAIFPVSTSVKLSEPKSSNRFTFRTVPSDKEAAEMLANQVISKKVAIFYTEKSNYSRSLKDAFKQKIGSELVTNVFDLSQPNFQVNDAIQKLIKAKTEVLVLFPDTETLDEVLKVAKANKESKNPLPVFGGDDVYSFKTLQEGQESVRGMTVAVPWSWKSPVKEDCQKENSNIENCFISNSKGLWDADVNWRTATSYDATKALIEAIKQDLENPTREGIAEKLRSLQVTGVTRKIISFSDTGDLGGVPNVQLVEVKSNGRKSRNTSGYDFERKE